MIDFAFIYATQEDTDSDRVQQDRVGEGDVNIDLRWLHPLWKQPVHTIYKCPSLHFPCILNRSIFIIIVVLLGSRVGNIVFMGLPCL